MALVDNPPVHNFPDQAVRELLEDHDNLREMLHEVVPDLAPHLDVAKREIVKRSFLLEDWRDRECDLFFRIPYKDPTMQTWVTICILLEHQSAPDPRMALRVLLYALFFWERQWKEWEDTHAAYEKLVLSPVVPIIFYTGAQPWNASRKFADLIACPQIFGKFAPVWDPLFWSLSEQDPQALLQSASVWMQSLAVVRGIREDSADFQKILGQVLSRLETLRTSQKARSLDLAWFVLSRVLRSRPKAEQQQIKQTLQAAVKNQEALKEFEAVNSTLGETLPEFVARQTALQTRQEDLRALLEARFKTVPEPILQRISATTDPEILKKCIRQVFDIKAPEELQLDAPPTN